MSTTPNMDLALPVPEVTTGPEWAQMIVDNYDLLDEHDHSLGKGIPVTPAGLNINTDLDVNGNLLTDVGGTRLTALGSQPAGGSDLRQIYSYNGELYYRDASGNQVKITDGGTVNVSATGGFSGDFGAPGVTASVPYSNSTKVYSFLQDTGISAPISTQQVKFLDAVSGSGTITLTAPGTTITSHTLTLPTALPGATALWQVSSSGALSYSNTIVENVTLQKNLAISTSGGSGTSVTAPRIEIDNGNVGDSFFLGLLGNKADTTNPAGITHGLIVSSGPTYAIYGSVDQSSYSSIFSLDVSSGLATLGTSSLTQPSRAYGGLRFENTYVSGMTYGIAKSSSTVLSLYNNTAAIVNVGATSVGIAAAATIDFANSAGSYTAPKLLAQNSNADVTGWGVYRNGTSPAGIGALATASNARLFYTADGGTTPLSLINVVAATGVISIGNGTHDSVAHSLSGSLNFGSTAALPTNGIGRSGGNQLSITTGSTERVRVTDSAVTVRNALISESTLALTGVATFSGAVDANSTADFQGVVNFQAAPTGAIASGNYTPTITATFGTFGALSKAQYQRIGNVVTVNIQFTLVTNGSSNYGFTISLPVARTAGVFSGSNEGWGTVVSGSTSYEAVGQSDSDIFGIIAIDGASTIGMTSFLSAAAPAQTRYFNVAMTYQLDN